MALIKACVEKCRDEKMLAWLYDEDRWPSGAAGGLLTQDPQYRARHLLLTTKPYGEGQAEAGLDSSARSARSENGTLLACYDVQLDENGCLTGARRIAETAKSGGTEMVRLSGNRPSQSVVQQPDLRQYAWIPLRCKSSWRSPTNAIWKPSARSFGGVVPAIFTDEPQFSHKSALAFARDGKRTCSCPGRTICRKPSGRPTERSCWSICRSCSGSCRRERFL